MRSTTRVEDGGACTDMGDNQTGDMGDPPAGRI